MLTAIVSRIFRTATPIGVAGVLLVVSGADRVEGRLSFAAAVDYPAGVTTISAAIADLDSDGRQDLVAMSVNSASITVRLQMADGTLGPRADFPTGGNPQAIRVADFNHDGRPDVVVANFAAGAVTVLLQNPDRSFGTPADCGTAPGPISVAVADLDRDGKSDLVAASSNADAVSVLIGHGDGTFSTRSDFAVGPGPSSVAIGMLDADTVPDLAVANRAGHSVSVLLGRGDGSFAPAAEFGVRNQPVSVALGDLNGDGALDLALANRGAAFTPDSTVSVLLGRGDGTYSPPAEYPVQPGPESVAIADLDGDGRLDLAAAHVGVSGVVSVLSGRGDGTFEPRVDFATGESPRSVVIGDLNGDDRPDLATANYLSNSTTVLINTSETTVGVGSPVGGGFVLAPPAPNPSFGAATVAFALPMRVHISLWVLDLVGRRVRKVMEGELSAGAHRVSWDGLDDRGRRVPPGVYYCEMRVGEIRLQQKLTVVR